eukprot:CAMPEP_0195062720 /NCGR_PEP_ID=MMETSP0448-20130528/9269_1 /TAXON_ID=66468 /ORGANISM="Heterocapsa triquestra, Strain CCMP 448" /LENGTH=43 /DNA_ID= /DNA_START= /DNA_END= /DNA_ORIENTATION=
MHVFEPWLLLLEVPSMLQVLQSTALVRVRHFESGRPGPVHVPV